LKLALYVPEAHNVSIPNHIKGIDMNLVKNMEAVFVAMVVMAGVATYATAEVTTAPAPAAQAEAASKVATVIVSAKRLTAAQKAQLDS
jgi:hypothetical protein